MNDTPQTPPCFQMFVLLSNLGGGNECMAPAAFTEIPSEAEENHKKQLGLTSQSMVKKTKVRIRYACSSMSG